MPIATFFENSSLAVAMCSAGIALLFIGAFAARRDFAEARGLDKLVTLSNMCFAAPLAVFGALHLFGPEFVKGLVPAYMPGRMFWVYFVGCALIAASLSIATRIGVRWSGILLGMMMFLFVAMLYLPAGIIRPDRITWTIVFREMSFGGAAWILAGAAIEGWRTPGKRVLINVGTVLIVLATFVFGVEHFLHPTGLPVVPLQKQMPAWLVGRTLIDYATGAALLLTGASILLRRNARTVATLLGAWILLLVLVIYGPVLVTALLQPAIEGKVEGINYFADTLFFAGVILALARAMPAAENDTSIRS